MKSAGSSESSVRTMVRAFMAAIIPDWTPADYSFSSARSYWSNVPRASGSDPFRTDIANSVSDKALVEEFSRELAIARDKPERKVGFKRATEIVEDLKAPRVMDYGSGMGFYGHEILSRHVSARVTFVDINPKNLAVIARICNATGFGDRADYVTVKEPKASDLAFSEHFDVIMSMGVLHHTPYARAIVANITKYLKPGGVFLALLYNRRYWRDMALRARRRINSATFGAMTDPSVESGSNPFSEPYTLRKAHRLFRGFQLVGVDYPNPYYDIYRFRKPSGPADPASAWFRWP